MSPATATPDAPRRRLVPVGFPSRFIPHVPHVKQHAGLLLDRKLEGLFGGAAGGGKSDWLLMGGLQYVEVPEYAALLLRKTYADLSKPGALIPRSQQWLAGRATYNESKHQWKFPSGATMDFGFIRNDNDLEQYQSAEYQYIGFDEVTHFSERQYTYMFSRLRRPGYTCLNCSASNDQGEKCVECGAVTLDDPGPIARVPLRVRGATNPGGRGHQWVKERFIEDPHGAPIKHPDRFFLPSLLKDNPSLDVKMYLISMEQLDEATRAQLLHGDWNAREPGNWMIPDNRWVDAAEALGREWAEAYTIPQPTGGSVIIGIDWGEFTQAYTIWPLPAGGIYIPPSETIGRHEDPAFVAPRIIREGTKFGFPVSQFRYDAAGSQSMKTFVNIARAQEGLERTPSVGVPFNKYKNMSINYLRLLFRRAFEGHDKTVIAIHPYNVELLRQLKFWERKYEETSDAITPGPAKKVDDHGPDALVAGVSGIAELNQKKIDKLIQQAYKSDGTPLAIEPEILRRKAA